MSDIPKEEVEDIEEVEVHERINNLGNTMDDLSRRVLIVNQYSELFKVIRSGNTQIQQLEHFVIKYQLTSEINPELDFDSIRDRVGLLSPNSLILLEKLLFVQEDLLRFLAQGLGDQRNLENKLNNLKAIIEGRDYTLLSKTLTKEINHSTYSRAQKLKNINEAEIPVSLSFEEKIVFNCIKYRIYSPTCIGQFLKIGSRKSPQHVTKHLGNIWTKIKGKEPRNSTPLHTE